MKKVHLSKKEHNRVFPRRPKLWSDSYEYYIDDDKAIVFKLTSKLAKAYVILMAPFGILMCGIPTYFREASDCFNEKKKGKFVEDIFYKHKNTYILTKTW